MDKNKLTKLREINYTVRRCCSNCMYGSFSKMSASAGSRPIGIFGTCSLHKYLHLKHTESIRDLSINVNGYCKKHEFIPDFLFYINHYKEFVEK